MAFTPVMFVKANKQCALGIYRGDFMKKVLSVYTHSMTTIYLSLSAQVAISTFFMKSPLQYTLNFITSFTPVLFVKANKQCVVGIYLQLYYCIYPCVVCQGE